MQRVKLTKNYKELTHEEILKITGGAKFKRGETIIELGGEYYRMFDIDVDASSQVYKIPVRVLKDRFYPTMRWVIFYAIYKREEFVVVEKYRQHRVKKARYPFFKPAGKVMWIRKEMGEEVVKGILDALQYEYSPEGAEIEVVEIKPDELSIRRDKNYEFGLDDFLPDKYNF